MHIIGKIAGAENFNTSTIYLKYSFKTSDQWQLMSGITEGDTWQTTSEHGKFVPLEHPIDINYVVKSIRGWPRLFVEVWQVDNTKRNSIAGYG